MISKVEFFQKYGLNENSLNKALLTWTSIEKFYNDYSKKIDEYKRVLLKFTNELNDIPGLKYIHQRVKDPEHLIEKIIRKGRMDITLENYTSVITDLLACKIIYLYKSDWRGIHEWISNKFEGMYADDGPVAYTIEKDALAFKEANIKVSIKKSKYQSIHYLVNYDGYIIEIQVRSIYQEAWGEIDHQLRYPYEIDNYILNDFSKLLNQLTTAGDDLAELIRQYKQFLIPDKKVFLTAEQIEKIKSILTEEQRNKFECYISENQELVTIGELLKRID